MSSILTSGASVSTETTSVVSQEEKVEETASVESKEEKVELWSKSYFVDEFEQPTDEWFVYNTTKFLGKFSNSATTDSSLTADVVVAKVGHIPKRSTNVGFSLMRPLVIS